MFLSNQFKWAIWLSVITVVMHAKGQDIPWHLGSLTPSRSAPASINSAAIRPGANRIVVAVIDSGILAEHPSLSGQLLAGYDIISPPNNMRGERSTNYSPDDRDARCGQRLISGAFRTHGTEVASLIAGNGVDGVHGVNPSAKIVPIKLFGACSMSRKDLLDAIAWAAGMSVAGMPANPYPARVINMSIAGGLNVCGNDLQQVINQVVSKGVFVVAAAGNNFHKPLPEPANCKNVISVGSVDAENRIEVYSALDPRTVIYAPGGGKKLTVDAYWSVNKLKVATYDIDLLGTERPASLYRGVGTSYAAPVVSGFISLWLSHYPSKQPADFTVDMPKFLRLVEPLEKCPDCSPKGLVVLTGALP